MWTLEKFYRVPKAEINELLLPIVGLKGMRCNSKAIIRHAFDIYIEKNIDWTDVFVAASMLTSRQEVISSYDRDFDKIDGLNRSIPSKSS